MFYYLYILNGKLKNVLSVDLSVLDNLHIICCQQYSNDCCIINSKEADLFLTLEVPIMPYGTNCYNKRNIWPICFKFGRQKDPLLNQTQVFETFVLYNFTVKWKSDKQLHTGSCKLSYCLGVYPAYSRNGVFLKVFIFYFADSSIQYVTSRICLLCITCGLSIYCYHFRKI